MAHTALCFEVWEKDNFDAISLWRTLSSLVGYFCHLHLFSFVNNTVMLFPVALWTPHQCSTLMMLVFLISVMIFLE